MAIRRPRVSVDEARRLARNRLADSSGSNAAIEPRKELPLAAEAVPAMPGAKAASPSIIDSRPPDPSAKPLEPGGTVGGVEGLPHKTVAAEAFPPLATPLESRSGPLFPETRPRGPKIQVFLSAPVPAKGVSASFDALGRHHPPTKALQMILRRALDNYEIQLDNGSYKSAPGSYPVDGPEKLTIIQTSRMVPVRLVETARAHFDPLGFESMRVFGRKLACAALASFFEAERSARR